jgi:hypothetical protein
MVGREARSYGRVPTGELSAKGHAMTHTTPMVNPVPAMVEAWQQTRAELRAIDEAEHSPIVDVHGRVWTWRDKTLYVHDQLACTADMIRAPGIGLPRQDRLGDNPNYDLCAICTQNWR